MAGTFLGLVYSSMNDDFLSIASEKISFGSGESWQRSKLSNFPEDQPRGENSELPFSFLSDRAFGVDTRIMAALRLPGVSGFSVPKSGSFSASSPAKERWRKRDFPLLTGVLGDSSGLDQVRNMMTDVR